MTSAPTRLQLNERPMSVVAESAAQMNAARQRSGQAVQSSNTQFAEQRGAARTARPGEPLGRALQGEMEARFGRDFSNIRVHANSEEAEAMGARAFTRGDEIAFAPGESPQKDRSLLAHELTHTTQQAEAGQALVQMDPKKGHGGIGNEPPSEPFTRSDKPAAEDDAVLFDINQATLSTRAVQALTRLAKGQQGEVVVEVHGYASGEGEADYNVNLSAHRAAAVKEELLRLLPKGSTVTLIAHGETSYFGPPEQNRRAGFKVITRPTPADQKAPPAQPTPDPTGDAPKIGIHLDPTVSGVRLFPPLTLSPTPLIPPSSTVVPRLGLTKPIDWLALRGKWAAYGLSLDPHTVGDIESYALMQRTASINFWTALGVGPARAAWLADSLQPIALGVTTSAYLSNNFPNQIDLVDREVKARYPDSWKTPQVPITDVIDFLYHQKTGKDLFKF